MNNRVNFLTPVGRLVQGHLYTPQTTDLEGRVLIYKTGAKAGQPQQKFWFALAVPKGSETHWNQTEWGSKIWEVGHQSFPNGQTNAPTFAWKVKDGDSNIPNREGRVPSQLPGFSGNWIINFSSTFAPGIYTISDGAIKEWVQENAINLGDYIEVSGFILGNGSSQTPGVFINPGMVCFRAYGERIVRQVDPSNVGFGKSALPAQASSTPVGSVLNNTVSQSSPAATYGIQINSNPVPPPHTAILSPPIPPLLPNVPVRNMTSKANGISFDQYVANGWTEALLIQHGYMLP